MNKTKPAPRLHSQQAPKEKKIIGKKIIATYFEPLGYEDYDPSENNGHVDHEGLVCKLCTTLFDDEDWGIGGLIEHFWKEHQAQAMEIKKGIKNVPV